jgi:flagellar protein FliL
MADTEVSQDDFKTPNAGAGSNPILIIILVLNSILVGAIAYFQLQTHKMITSQPSVAEIADSVKLAVQKEADETELTAEGKEEDGILFPLQGFTANLAQGDGPRRFVRLNSVLKFSKGSNEEEFKARTPQIRDAVISVLNSKRPEDLLKVEGKKYLKEEIKAAINTFLVDGSVIDVYYVGFQIN